MTINSQAKHHILYVCQDSRIPPGINVLMEQMSVQLDIWFERVSSIRAVLELVGKNEIELDVIILDIDTLNDGEGSTPFDIVSTLTTLLRYHRMRTNHPTPNPEVPAIVIGVSAATDPRRIRELLTLTNISGIYPSGYDFSLGEKMIAVREFVARRYHVPKSIKQILAAKHKIIGGDIGNALTTRQSQILDLVVSRGASNKAIANILHITDSTVKLHMTAILKKCGVRSRTQLVAFHVK